MNTAMLERSNDMAYETKALFIAIANIMRLSKDMKQAYDALAEIANVEGVVLKPLESLEADKEVKS